MQYLSPSAELFEERVVCMSNIGWVWFGKNVHYQFLITLSGKKTPFEKLIVIPVLTERKTPPRLL